MRTRSLRAILLAGCVTSQIPGAASAQTPAAPSGVAVQAANPIATDEIIVTAQKRSQSLNDVGVSIQAISGLDLARQRITTLNDISLVTPGLSFATTQANTPVFTLRGIGFYENALAAYPTVSVYQDEFPLPFPAMTKLSAFDLERLEVLKGPQGTLYGQNSTGGAVNYIAAKPTNDFSAGGDLTYGRFNDVEWNGYVSGPITPTLAARLSGRVVRQDGWQKSYTRDDTTGKTRTYAGRLLLDWQPSDRFQAQLNVTGWKDRSDPQAAQYIFANPQQPQSARPDVLAYPIAPDNPRAADWSPDTPPRASNRFIQAGLRMDYKLSDDISLTSLTTYNDYKTNQVPEGDGQSFHTFDFVSDKGFIRDFNQEIRLSNSATSRLRWVVGGNYENAHVYENLTNIYNASSTTVALGSYGAGLYSDQRLHNYAGFANVEYDLNRYLTVIGGVRYTQANRSSTNCSYDNDDGVTNAFFTGLGSLLSGTTVAPLQPGQCFTLLANNIPGPVYRSTLNENNVSWRVGLNYKPSRDVLLYATIAKGYKAGSIPTTAGATYLQYAPVRQESVLAYEAGVKATLLNRTLSASAALYYYDYRDKQLRGKQIDPVFGSIEALVNIPKVRVYGGEWQLTARPTPGLMITLAGTYTNATVTDFIGVNAGGQLGDFAGAPVPFTPKFANSVSGEYEIRGGSLVPFIGGDLQARSGTTSVIGGGGPTVEGKSVYSIKGYETLNLRAGIRSSDDRWQAMVWGKNVTNNFYWNNVVAQSDVVVRYAGLPATYCVTIGYKF